jgi:hypothetical protein
MAVRIVYTRAWVSGVAGSGCPASAGLSEEWVMDQTERDGQPRTPDTSEHSASKAPETQTYAEERDPYADWRLIPGGAHGAHTEIGMSAMDRDQVPSGAEDPRQTLYGDSPDDNK